MKINLILIALFFFAENISAQKFNYGKTNKEDFTDKVCQNDSSAVAAIIYKKTRCYFVYNEKTGFDCLTENLIRIRIFKSEGLNYANFDVPYYVGWTNIKPDVVTFKDCYTHNYENGKIERIKLNSEGEFKETINSNWKKKTITMPNVKVGSIIDIKYTKKSENISKLPDFQFQHDIPVLYANYTSEIPEVYDYKTILRGYLELTLKQKYQQVTQNFDSKAHLANVSRVLEYRAIVSEFEISDVPALKEEPFIDNIENYRSKLEHELQSIRAADERNNKYFSKSWDDVAKSIYNEEGFGKQLQLKIPFENDINNLVSADDSKIQMANKIFTYVQKRMNWNKKQSFITYDGVEKAYQNKSGNSAEINFILIALLKHFNIYAQPVLLSTRSNGFMNIPSRDGFNYVIASVDIDGKRLLLDATDKFNVPGILPFRAVNGVGRLITRNGESEFVNLKIDETSRETNTIMASIDKNGLIEGKWRRILTNNLAYSKSMSFQNLEQNQKDEKIENQYNINVSEYTIENSENEEYMGLTETVSFNTNQLVEIIGEKMYINPLLFLTKNNSPFKSDERNFPIDFIFHFKEKYQININVPSEFKVEHVPPSSTMAIEGNQVLFSFNLNYSGNQIQLVANFEVNLAVIQPGHYLSLKKLFQAWIDKQQEKVILIKS